VIRYTGPATAVRAARRLRSGGDRRERRRCSAQPRRRGSRHHPDLAITLHNLACCHLSAGRRRLARHYLRRAVAILEKAAAPRHPTLLACRDKLQALGQSGSGST